MALSISSQAGAEFDHAALRKRLEGKHLSSDRATETARSLRSLSGLVNRIAPDTNTNTGGTGCETTEEAKLTREFLARRDRGRKSWLA
jgi:hypothetical protein